MKRIRFNTCIIDLHHLENACLVRGSPLLNKCRSCCANCRSHEDLALAFPVSASAALSWFSLSMAGRLAAVPLHRSKPERYRIADRYFSPS